MISILLLSLTPAPAASPSLAPPVPFVQDGEQDEVAKKIEACGEDVAKLEALAAEYTEAKDKASARKVYERILELDENHEAAHKGLRHHFYDGQWFTSYASLSKYRREEAKRMKEEFGLVRYNNEWVPEKDLPYIRMGWTKEGDTYVNPAKAARVAERKEMEAKEYQQRVEDSLWIAPEEFDKWSNGLFKVDGDWVTEAEANAYHGEIGQWWKYRGEHFVAWTTATREKAAWVAWYADQTYPSLVRLYGLEPEEKPILATLKSLAQYNNFAAGDQNAGRGATESGGFSSCHFAYLGDIWFDVSNQQIPDYIGGGVSFWDYEDENMSGWGPFSIRHAAGLSYGESIDHAWDTISQLLTNQGGGGLSPDAIWEEKSIPRWMLYGGASYVERFAPIETDENPIGVRNWAISQLAATGKLDPIDDIFVLRLDLNDLEGSTRRIHEAGLVTAFVLDGGCKPVTAAHQAFKDKLKAGEDTKEAVAALQQAIAENADALVEFGGIEIATREEADAAAAAAAEAAAAAAAAAAPAAADGATDGADAAGADGGEQQAEGEGDGGSDG